MDLVRYPDPSVQVLDDSFAKYRVFNGAVERLATGFRWAEGPVWFGDARCLLWSDIPNNRIMRWDEETGAVSVFRKPSNFSNGNTRDRQGRLVTCEHDSRRVTRTEYDGTITVVLDRFDGKPLNSPNDVVVKSDDSIWFTDPPFGILSNYEGHTAPVELPTNVYRVDGRTGAATVATGDVPRPNGLCFSPDERRLYVVASGAIPREIRVFDVSADGTTLVRRPRLRRLRRGDSRRLSLRYGRQSLVRLGWRRGAGRRGRLQPGRQAHRPDLAARALRQPLLRWREEEPLVHGRESVGVRGIRQRPGRDALLSGRAGGSPCTRSTRSSTVSGTRRCASSSTASTGTSP